MAKSGAEGFVLNWLGPDLGPGVGLHFQKSLHGPVWVWLHQSTKFDPKEKMETRGWTAVWRLPQPRFMVIFFTPSQQDHRGRVGREVRQGLMFVLEQLQQQGALRVREIKAGVLQGGPHSSPAAWARNQGGEYRCGSIITTWETKINFSKPL